jgi:hypothetical protein
VAPPNALRQPAFPFRAGTKTRSGDAQQFVPFVPRHKQEPTTNVPHQTREHFGGTKKIAAAAMPGGFLDRDHAKDIAPIIFALTTRRLQPRIPSDEYSLCPHDAPHCAQQSQALLRSAGRVSAIKGDHGAMMGARK